MPLRDYVRSIQDAFHREPNSESSNPAAQTPTSGSASDDIRLHVRGDLPSTKLFIPDASLRTLVRTVFRPHDKMSGVITALHGALGAPDGYSAVEVTLYVTVRLTKTSTKGKRVGNIMIGDSLMGESRSYDIDTFETRTFNLARDTLYDYESEGRREGKEINLPFQLSIPSEAEGFQLGPSVRKFLQYSVRFRATEFDTGLWRELYLDEVLIKPRDDVLASIDSLTKADPFMMISPYQEFDVAKQPGWVQSRAAIVEVPCPLLRGWKVQEAEGTNEVRLFAPSHDMFVQKPFPLVLKLSVIAPATYGPKNLDWNSFRLEIPTGASSELHRVQTWIKMTLPNARGGDGILRERVALQKVGLLFWDPVHPAPTEDKEYSGSPGELRNGLDWSQPQLEPPTSRYAGRWASHAIVKGVVKLYADTPTTFDSTEGDFRIYNNINTLFWPKSRYLATSLGKVIRDPSQPIPEEANVPDGEQPPPYST